MRYIPGVARPRDDDVKRRILQATFFGVAQSGVAGVSLRHIARQAGVSAGTLTYHFTSLSQLILEAVDFGYTRLPEQVQTLTVAEQVEWALHRFVLDAEPRRVWWRFWLSVISYAEEEPAIQERIAVYHQNLLTAWEGGLADGVRRGSYRSDLDVAAEAKRLSVFAHGLAAVQLTDASLVPWAAEELSRQLNDLRRRSSA